MDSSDGGDRERKTHTTRVSSCDDCFVLLCFVLPFAGEQLLYCRKQDSFSQPLFLREAMNYDLSEVLVLYR